MFRRIALPVLFFSVIALTQQEPSQAAGEPNQIRLDRGFTVELQTSGILLRNAAGKVHDQVRSPLAAGDFWTNVTLASQCRINGTGGTMPGMIVQRRADGSPRQVWIASAELGRLVEGRPEWALCQPVKKSS